MSGEHDRVGRNRATVGSGGADTRVVRRGLLAVLVLGLVGLAAELVLLVHYEDVTQVIPLGLAAGAIGALVWGAARPGGAAIAALKVLMIGCIAAGMAGVVLHFQANAEFQREIDPALAGWDLFWKVVRAKAPPALAPGVMVQLGMIGWLYAALHDGRNT